MLVDAAMGAGVTAGAAGRFVFYRRQQTLVLCGFSDGERMFVANPEQDPAALAADAQRTLAKRKIFFGGMMILTIVLISFGVDKLRQGRGMLKDHPRPKRPSEATIRHKLER